MTANIAQNQIPGAYRHKAGHALVTALNDGFLLISHAYLNGITEPEADAIRLAAGRRAPFVSAVNAFLVQSPGSTVLIDAGAGNGMGPMLGKLPHSLTAAGVGPGDVDTVLLTHLHADHFGGLLDPSGAPVFPAAEIIVPQAEMDYWFSDAEAAAAPEAKRDGFARVRTALAHYGNRIRPLAAGKQPAPGIEAVSLPGHTPGHTGYFVGDGEERVLIWGDIYHLPDLQSLRPDVSVTFDADPAQAIITRTAIQARAAAEGLIVAGMHMHFPGFSRIARSGSGYAVQPLPWRAVL